MCSALMVPLPARQCRRMAPLAVPGKHTAIFVRELNRNQLDSFKAAELGLVSSGELKSLNQRIEVSTGAVVERLRSTLETLTPYQDVVAALRCVDGVASVVVPSMRVMPTSAFWARISRRAFLPSATLSRNKCCL